MAGPAYFLLYSRKGQLKAEEMFNVFNMGIGFVLAVKEDDLVDVISGLEQDGESLSYRTSSKRRRRHFRWWKPLMKKFAIFASGSRTNFQAIIDTLKEEQWPAKPPL